MITIGFAGYAGSGKDAAGAILVERGWRRYAFAEPLYECALALDPIIETASATPQRLTDVVQRWGWDNAKQHPEVRRTLQRLGTEVGRCIINPDLWISLLDQRMAADEAEHAVITDVRFANELAYVRRHGTVVWIARPGVGPVNAHPSDNAIGPGDCTMTIINDGTIDNLAETLRSIESTILNVS